MKTLILTLTLMLAFSTQMFGSLHTDQEKLHLDADTTETDSVEYELIVTELGFESYLVTQPMMELYSISYYKNWNYLYVQEWNHRYRTGPRQEIYENEIDYDRFTDYPLELEYRLYYFFRFFEEKYNVKLVARAR